MDRGKRPSNFLAARNNKIYMDLKDIIREHALLFLPAKVLFRFSGVCRDWKIHITSPFFAHNQSLSFRTISGFFVQSFGDPPSFVPLDPLCYGVPDPSLKFLPEPVFVRASSNGLVCCQGQSGDRPYYICNIVTQQWKRLPKPEANHGTDPAVVLLFEPSLLNFVAEYRLMCAFQSSDFDDATEFEIYSSKDGTWKISREIHFSHRKLILKPGVFVNDVVYWMTNCGTLAFDLIKERSQVLPGHCSETGTIGVIGGRLYSAYMSGPALNMFVLSNIYSNTMEMDSKERTWSVSNVIHLGYEMVCQYALDHAKVLFIGGDVAMLQKGQKIYYMHLKTKDIKLVHDAPKVDVKCLPYVNSLSAL